MKIVCEYSYRLAYWLSLLLLFTQSFSVKGSVELQAVSIIGSFTLLDSYWCVVGMTSNEVKVKYLTLERKKVPNLSYVISKRGQWANINYTH